MGIFDNNKHIEIKATDEVVNNYHRGMPHSRHTPVMKDRQHETLSGAEEVYRIQKYNQANHG